MVACDMAGTRLYEVAMILKKGKVIPSQSRCGPDGG